MKRFYKDVALKPAAAGVSSLRLDGRPVKTPSGRVLELPVGGFADAVADEWRAQEGDIDPGTMPFTRLANTVLDGIAERKDEVVASLTAYAQTDLLCYGAETPQALVEMQVTTWQPILERVSTILGAPIATTSGIAAITQDARLLEQLRSDLDGLEGFALAAFHEMTTLTGSVLLALAVLHGVVDEVQAWNAAHVDEKFQQQQWGVDDEAQALHEIKQASFRSAVRALRLLGAIT